MNFAFDGLFQILTLNGVFRLQVKIKILNFLNVIFSEELQYIYHNSEYFSGATKNKQVTHLYYLVIFCVSLSLSELRGVRLLKGIFYEEFT
jgi:hypothetical protein